MSSLTLSGVYKLKESALKLLSNEEVITEAYHPKDKEVIAELLDLLRHHQDMKYKHGTASSLEKKQKDVSNHDLAGLAHDFAAKHYGNLTGGGGVVIGSLDGRSGLPEDYHQDKDWYDKLNGMVSSRADKKSKDCGL